MAVAEDEDLVRGERVRVMNSNSEEEEERVEWVGEEGRVWDLGLQAVAMGFSSIFGLPIVFLLVVLHIMFNINGERERGRGERGVWEENPKFQL